MSGSRLSDYIDGLLTLRLVLFVLCSRRGFTFSLFGGRIHLCVIVLNSGCRCLGMLERDKNAKHSVTAEYTNIKLKSGSGQILTTRGTNEANNGIITGLGMSSE